MNANSTLTMTQAAEIQAALIAARNGKATLSQLARAHDLATGAELGGCLGELRAHIRRLTPAPPSHVEAFRDIALGVIAGFITEHLLSKR